MGSNLHVLEQLDGTEIAVIGMTCRFPGAKNVDEFWRNLRNGVESIAFFSDQELEASGIDPATLQNPNYVKAGAVLEDIEMFDAPFFGLTPREAEIMDPQHRLFLECAWEALEGAGYDPETYQAPVGVYAGVFMSTYLFNLYSNRNLVESVGELAIRHGNEKDYLATRSSYKFNLRGPSISVQTSCSTSLVAVHLACQSLMNGECDMALAGGVSIRVPQKIGYMYQEGGILSPDGHCRAFDARAKGTIFGQGVGIVVLKRLADALADGDCIHAVIKGTAINNDGASKVGYTAPSIDGQAEVIAEALAMAKIEPDTITYVEAHGTGTSLGDPIEIAALTQAFGASTQRKGFCAIGSVKTNVGHLGTAAGVVGLIKAVLALKYKEIPPSLHFEKPNPHIDFANSPFYVNNTLAEWKVTSTPRRAGVSSFGMGGTNAHAVLEETPSIETSSTSRSWHVLVLSARTSAALETATTSLVEYLKHHPDTNLADVAYTLQVGRRAFNHRRVLVCRDLDDAIATMEMLDPKRVLTAAHEPRVRPVTFMFPGQGTQYVNMALGLYQGVPTFREQIDICADLLKPQLGIDLRAVIYPSGEEEDEAAAERLKQTFVTQPALFAIEYALAKLWMEWGVLPQAMIGHSIGEYVAACLAGVFSLEDALSLVVARGQLMQELPTGSMLAVPLLEREVRQVLSPPLSLAAINGPSLCVVAGPTEAVRTLHHRLTEQGMECRWLHTSHAFHSTMMDPIVETFTKRVRNITLNPPQIPYISNVTGTWITAAEATDPSYWATHLRQTVRFAEGVHELLKDPDRILLEVGPGQTLSTLAKQDPEAAGRAVLLSLRHLHDRYADVPFLLNTLGQLWLAGVPIDWSGLYANERRHRIPLPTYPFERQRYWIEPQKQLYNTNVPQSPPDKKPEVADWFYIPSWKRSVPPQLLEQEGQTGLPDQWLVFVDSCGLGPQIVKRLEQAGRQVTAVMVGEQFTKCRDRLYMINPRRRDHYCALLEELQALDTSPKVIAHLWNITPNSSASFTIEAFEKSQELGFYSLLFLAQALQEHNLTDSIQITVVSDNMHEVTGEEMLSPEKATVLGPCKVLPQEYVNITCRSIDIVLPESGTWREKQLLDQLIAELIAEPSDAVIAYRGNHRLVRTFEPVQLNSKNQDTTRLRKEGVYLITGGLEGPGFAVAEFLAKTMRAKLVLIECSGLPSTEELGQRLSGYDGQDQAAIMRKLKNIEVLENLGAEVLVVTADISSMEQMQTAIAQIYERFGEIQGVIHAAAFPDRSLMQREGSEMATRLFTPQVRGTLVLEAALQHVPLDFLILFSSTVSITGGFGQLDQCAIGAFLDAFALYNFSKHGVLTVSIDWGMRQRDESQETLVASAPRIQPQPEQMKAREGITLRESVDAFSRILSTALPQIIVSAQDFQAVIEQYNARTVLGFRQKEESVRSSEPAHPRPVSENAYVSPRDEVEQSIVELWRELFGIKEVGIHDNFFDLGGNSLLAIQIISRLRNAFQVELPLDRLFEDPTVAGLAKLITEGQPEREELEELDQLLKEIESLSSDEIQKELMDASSSDHEEGMNG